MAQTDPPLGADVGGELPYTGDIEIRIHGVSGTPPEDLLDRSAVQQVSGDRIAGFYRPSVPQQQRDTARALGAGSPAQRPGPWLEGYSWGGWTSGAKSRALWLVLLPFALINVAPRMLAPDPAGSDLCARLRRCIDALIRVISLSLTATLVLGGAIVSMSTVAGRCAPSLGVPPVGAPDGAAPVSVCHGLPRFLLGWLDALTPAGRLGLMALVPIALVGALWAISYSAAVRYQTGSGDGSPTAPRADTGGGARPGRADDDPIPLARADLWTGFAAVRRLRLVHVQAGFCTTGWVLAWLMPSNPARTAALWVGSAVLAACAVLAVLRPSGRALAGSLAALMLPARCLWAGIAALLALDLVLVIGGSRLWPAGAWLDPDLLVVRADRIVQGLFIGQGLVLGLILAALAITRLLGAGRGMRLFMGGYSAFFISFLAWLMGSVLTAAVLILVPAWLSTTGFALTPGRLTAVLESSNATWFGSTSRSTGVGMLVGLAVIAALLAQLAVRFIIAKIRGGGPADWDALRRDYPEQFSADEPRPTGRAREIGFMFFTARRVDRVPRGIAVFCGAVIAFLALQLVGLGVGRGQDGGTFFGWILGRPNRSCTSVAAGPDAPTAPCSSSWQVAWGAYLTAGLLLVVVLGGIAAYRARATRRGIGVLWDLTCFWPRDVHPMAPPCYNERIIPEVTARVDWYVGDRSDPGYAATLLPDQTGERRGRVVIAAHSQGTPISMAVVLLIRRATRQRVALMTFGCVLDRLYARFFPRYFSEAAFREVASALSTGERPHCPPRWSNPWRNTDYLGGSVPYPPSDRKNPTVRLGGPAGDDGPFNVKFVDPVFAVQPGTVLYPAAGRHSGFWLSPKFQDSVNALFDGTNWPP